MTSLTDKLFQKKLETFQRPAPSGAWERIEKNIDTTDNRAFWFKIAAGVALLSVATFILWPAESSENGIAKTNTQSIDKTFPKEAAVQKVISSDPIAKQAAEQKVVVNKTAVNKKSTLQKTASKQSTEKPIEQSNNNSFEAITQKESSSVTVATIEAPSTVQVASNTIVYTAEEVNSKYLRKKSAVDATVDEKKSSGMQKLMGLAYALKNNESGLSNLRQKKDEILALNFLTEDKNNKRKN